MQQLCLSFFIQLLIHVMPPEIKEMPGGKEALQKMLKEMEPVSVNEKKLLIISCLLLFWVTEKKLHPFDTTTVTITGIMLMMLPRIGFMSWKDAVPHINWGTVALFGVGISRDTALFRNPAQLSGSANHFVALFGMETMTPLVVIAILAFFLTVIHLGFASATGLASAMILIVIAVLQSVKTLGIHVLGITNDSPVHHLLRLYSPGQCTAERDRLQYRIHYIQGLP